jgi:hypothetical protein
MNTEQKLIAMETPMSRFIMLNGVNHDMAESTLANGTKFHGFDGGSTGGISEGISVNGSVVVGDSKFDYKTVGPEGYAEKVNTLLDEIASTDSGAELLKEITKNGGDIKINYGKGDAFSKGNLFSRETVITFNPNHTQKIVTTSGPREAQPKFILAHELHHAWKNTLNCWFGCSRPLILPGSVPTGLDPMEVHAVRYTNMIRHRQMSVISVPSIMELIFHRLSRDCANAFIRSIAPTAVK